jgi:hypothetical protein
LDCGDTIRVCTYSIGCRRDNFDAKQIKKEWRKTAMKRVNLRNAQEKLDARIAYNFRPNDWHVVFTLSDDCNTPDYLVLRKYWRSFLRSLRLARQKRGAEQPCYVYCMEGLHGDKRLHIHAILQRVPGDIEEIVSLWRYGEARMTPLESWEHCSHMGSYLTKEPRKLGRRRTDQNIFVASRSCVRPLPQYVRLEAGQQYCPPEGYVRIHAEDITNEVGEFHYAVYRRT